MLELNSKEVCVLLNVMSNAASVVRNETSSDKQDKMIIYIYNKAIKSKLDVYPVVSLYYNGKTYRHIAKSDEEIIKDSTFMTEKIIDEYPQYSRLYKDLKQFTLERRKYEDCTIEYIPCKQMDKSRLTYTISFTFNGHKYGVDFNYSLYHGRWKSKHIISLYSKDLKDVEYYNAEELPYEISDIIDDAFDRVENMLLTDEVRQIIHTYIEKRLNDLSVQSFN